MWWKNHYILIYGYELSIKYRCGICGLGIKPDLSDVAMEKLGNPNSEELDERQAKAKCALVNWCQCRAPNLTSSIWDGYRLHTSSLHHHSKSFCCLSNERKNEKNIFKNDKKKKKKNKLQEAKAKTILPTSSLKNSNCWIHPSSTSSAGAPAWILTSPKSYMVPQYAKQKTAESQLNKKNSKRHCQSSKLRKLSDFAVAVVIALRSSPTSAVWSPPFWETPWNVDSTWQ